MLWTERWKRHGKVARAAAPFVVHGGAAMCLTFDESQSDSILDDARGDAAGDG